MPINKEDDEEIAGRPKLWRWFVKHLPFLAYVMCGLAFALLCGAAYLIGFCVAVFFLGRERESTAFIIGYTCAGIVFLWGSYILYRRGGGAGSGCSVADLPLENNLATRPAEDESLTDKDIIDAFKRARKKRRKRGQQ